MSHILIADAGSTKIHWALLNLQTGESRYAASIGVNPLQQSFESIINSYWDIQLWAQDCSSIDEIFYYGAGCVAQWICDKVKGALEEVFPCDKINVYSDMLASAHSLLGNEKGIACILGTGSNVCFYDGSKIAENVPPLGFILGDDGGGAALGKRFIGNLFKGLLPDNIKAAFDKEFKLPIAEVINRVYSEPKPAAFLATFTPFILKNSDCPSIYEIINQEFAVFFRRNLVRLVNKYNYPVRFSGSVAFYFEKYLRESAKEFGIEIDRIVKDPLEGLVKYYKENYTIN